MVVDNLVLVLAVIGTSLCLVTALRAVQRLIGKRKQEHVLLEWFRKNKDLIQEIKAYEMLLQQVEKTNFKKEIASDELVKIKQDILKKMEVQIKQLKRHKEIEDDVLVVDEKETEASNKHRYLDRLLEKMGTDLTRTVI